MDMNIYNKSVSCDTYLYLYRPNNNNGFDQALME